MPDTDGAWATTRFVDPDDLAHDMHVNIVTFQPGGSIPFAETHVMEHGLFVLEGKGVYRLNGDWVEVEAGDFMWLRAFCPQACYAGGPGPFRYLLYKDVNRQVRLTDLRATGRGREPMGVSERMPQAGRRGIRAVRPRGRGRAGARRRRLHARRGRRARRRHRADRAARIRTRRPPASCELADDEVLIPGLVDTHVHVNEPGRTEWEGFASATRAAAAGGVTTIVDMPLNSIPPTTSVAALAGEAASGRGRRVRRRRDSGAGSCPATWTTSGRSSTRACSGSSASSCDSGVDEFPPVTRRRDGGGDGGARRRPDSLLIVHAEDAALIDAAPHPHSPTYADFLASRPRGGRGRRDRRGHRAQPRAPARARTSCTSATASALESIAAGEARRGAPHRRDLPALPHAHAPRTCPTGATAYKCCPPIREAGNRDALWRGPRVEGVIDFIVSDHSPAPASLKFAGDGDFAEAWGGIASLQLGLPLVWTEARRRGIALARVVEWMSAGAGRAASA